MKYKLPVIIVLIIHTLSCNWALSNQKGGNILIPPANSDKSLMAEETKKDTEKWKPAIFKGIQVGKDSRDLARKKFGKPTWSGEPEDQNKKHPEIWDNYENVDELHKNITVMSSLKDGTILAIESHQDNLTVEEAMKIFGDDYKKTSYEFIPCTLKDGDGEIIEATSGSFTFIEYRSKGIVLRTDSSQKEVHDIEYRSGPIGVQEPPC